MFLPHECRLKERAWKEKPSITIVQSQPNEPICRHGSANRSKVPVQPLLEDGILVSLGLGFVRKSIRSAGDPHRCSLVDK